MPPRAATAGQWRSYSVLVTEDLNLRVVPEPLVEVLSQEQYEVRACACASLCVPVCVTTRRCVRLVLTLASLFSACSDK